MTIANRLHYRVRNAPVINWPYPHILVEDVFPWQFYERLRSMIPPIEAYTKLGDTGRVSKGAYPQRHVFYFALPEYQARLDEQRRAFWSELASWLLSDSFMQAVLGKFSGVLKERFEPGTKLSLRAEACLMKDLPEYALGPHTDSPRKVVSMLFYLPQGCEHEHVGTSMYVPKDASFRCGGGPHYPRDGFDLVYTAPFQANTLFAFGKSDKSFHGVEKVEDGVTRELMLYDIYRTDV